MFEESKEIIDFSDAFICYKCSITDIMKTEVDIEKQSDDRASEKLTLLERVGRFVELVSSYI